MSAMGCGLQDARAALLLTAALALAVLPRGSRDDRLAFLERAAGDLGDAPIADARRHLARLGLPVHEHVQSALHDGRWAPLRVAARLVFRVAIATPVALAAL